MKTIVTLTSFPKRMYFVPQVLRSIYAQTQRPDIVVLHLSEAEYPAGQVPAEVQPFVTGEGLELRWHSSNERQWKKLIPTMMEWPDGEIVSIDDDIIYPPYFVARITAELRANGHTCPVTCGHIRWPNYGGIKTHYGCFTATMAKFHAPYVFELYDRDIRPIALDETVASFDDELYTHTALMNGILYQGSSMDLNNLRSINRLPGPISHGVTWRDDFDRWNTFVHDLISHRYGIDTRARARQLMKNHDR